MKKVAKLYWLWLSGKCPINSSVGTQLLDCFENPENIYHATESEYKECGVSDETVERLCDKNLDFAEDIEEYCAKNNIGILTRDDSLFPSRLKNIRNSPLLLYYRGILPDMNEEVLIAAVGTRSCSEYGAKTAYNLGYDLALGGAVTVSGMAVGIDGMIHRGTLKARGYTIAVLGCGIDVCYPLSHKRLMEAIISHGAVISEFPPKTQPHGTNFPIRNRIISGISQGCVVVEADMQSGSLITADYAAKQGRDIFAVPGNIDDKYAAGTNNLIKNGAKMITCAADILEEYELMYPFKIFVENIYNSRLKVAANDDKIFFTTDRNKIQKRKKNINEAENLKKDGGAENSNGNSPSREKGDGEKDEKNLPSDKFEREIYERLKYAMSPDELVRENEEIPDILSALTMLEIGGFIKSVAGGKFTRA